MTDLYRFAVVSDLHYCLDRNEAVRPRSAEGEPFPQYMWMRTQVFPKLLSELRAHVPEVVIATGDIAEAGTRDTELRRRELTEVFERFADAGLRLLCTRGSHASMAHWQELALPPIATALGDEVTLPNFAFDTPAGRFVLLDYLELEPGSHETQWLREQVEATPVGTPLFLFVHAPWVAVARPFFVPEVMQGALNEACATRLPTALFCGHTHNQALTHHRRAQGSFVQIMVSSVGFPALAAERLEDRHPLLLGDGDTYYWGVPEDQCPGYWIVDVDGNRITGSWYGIDRGLLGSVQLSPSGGEPTITQAPQFDVGPLRVSDLPLVEQARLEVCMKGDVAGDFSFVLNGCALGCMPSNDYYAARRSLPLMKEALYSLTTKNELVVTRGSATSWVLGGARIVADTFDGRRLASRVPPYILVSGDYATSVAGAPRFLDATDEGQVHLSVELDPT